MGSDGNRGSTVYRTQPDQAAQRSTQVWGGGAVRSFLARLDDDPQRGNPLTAD